MTTIKTLRCYGCDVTAAIEKFRYECMCMERRGVCKDCVVKNTSEWKEIPDEHHNLQKLHDITPEFKEWFAQLDKECPGWFSYTITENGQKIFMYYETPDGKCGMDAENWIWAPMYSSEQKKDIKESDAKEAKETQNEPVIREATEEEVRQSIENPSEAEKECKRRRGIARREKLMPREPKMCTCCR